MDWIALPWFPIVYGAVDGCLVMGIPAFNLTALVDDQKRFMAYSLRPGSQNDRMLFRNSIFGSARCIPSGGFILADAGYTF
ncbi:hypothetical protein H257_00587 [Aphanomyces astaci]|uniref:DDE Tnp4 domain-containing protein n=1 Tax=Aphanomyces astaci TaxID=112090 RepID=W4HCB5_APHAT|nr:hypothetical protein H257_00587 [Aphanomyces astaci]ETV89231.1 hypothetical protein H257_00587 [Aphanomyces astaci]|eukprot:XP_009821631.1 hypothetical protein H257_00587 [Aphanomyces astaci]